MEYFLYTKCLDDKQQSKWLVGEKLLETGFLVKKSYIPFRHQWQNAEACSRGTSILYNRSRQFTTLQASRKYSQVS